MTDIRSTVRLHFTQTMGLGQDSAERLLQKAGDVLARDLEALEACIAEGGADLGARLHKLKGDLSNIGLGDLAEAVHALGGHATPLPGAQLAEAVAGVRRTLAPLLPGG